MEIKQWKKESANIKKMLNRAKHKTILVKILKEIYTNTELGPVLGFKGGTAAYLFYNLERFSVDLDFDLLDTEKEQQVLASLEEIAASYGTIKDKSNKRHGLLLVISYEEDLTNIKIEVNRRNFGSRYETKSYLGIPMQVMVQEDMFAHKLVAMHERMGGANRDIFDVWFFLKNDWPINEEIVEQRTGKSFSDFLGVCIAELEALPNNGILDGVGELISEEKRGWFKENLKEETIFHLKLMLDRQSKE